MLALHRRGVARLPVVRGFAKVTHAEAVSALPA